MKHILLFTMLFIFYFSIEIPAQEISTWETIQLEILNKNCISCHQSGTSFARQSGLVLTEDVAYSNLIAVPAKNTAAAADGLVRVSSEGTIAAPKKSFLWEKVNAPEQDHFFIDHPNYGAIMPLGLPFLTNGELAFIRSWIEAGAPESEIVADLNLLDDTTRYVPPEFVALEPPENGFQFHLGPFDVWPAEVHDREFLYFEPLQTTEDVYVSRYEISFRPGSHHFILYNYPAGSSTPQPRVYRDLRDSQGNYDPIVANQLNDLFPFFFFVGTQAPFVNYHFPPGVALRLPVGSGFDLNSHSVNRSQETHIGEVYANLYTVDRSEVEHVADYDNFGNFDIDLPPNRITTISKTFYFIETRHIIQMWSHSHEHTLEFRIEGVGGEHDGELLYWSNDWEHPPLLELDPPLTMNAGDGLKLVTTYNNWTNSRIEYGPLSSDEMQFVFYIYYTGELTSVADNRTVPESFWLAQNHPNPFNSSTKISYSIPNSNFVTLKIYDILGRELQTVVNGSQQAATYSINFDASRFSSGIYFYRLQVGNEFVETKKMLFLR